MRLFYIFKLPLIKNNTNAIPISKTNESFDLHSLTMLVFIYLVVC